MKNIFIFLWRYRIFLLFLVLEFFGIFLTVRNNFYHSTVIFNSTNSFTSRLLKTVTNIKDYFHLKSVNEELVKENAFLKSMHSSSFIIEESNFFFREDTLFRRKFSFIPAKIINNSVNRTNNYLTLNVGKRHGIEKGMGVLSPSGVAGIVKEVSQNYASVYSVLHNDIKISGRITDENVVGTVQWDGFSYKFAKLNDIARYHKVEKGDTVFTSGYTQIFPEGIPIGYVSEIRENKARDFLDITIELATDFSKISHVYVVKNLVYEEQEMLEKQTQHE